MHEPEPGSTPSGTLEVNMAEQYEDKNGWPIEMTPEGFRVYIPGVPIRIGDVVRLRSEQLREMVSCTPFGAMVVSGVEQDDLDRNVWLLSRPHCTIWALHGTERDAQCAVQFERLHVPEAEFRKKFVAYVTGPSGEIDNRRLKG